MRGGEGEEENEEKKGREEKGWVLKESRRIRKWEGGKEGGGEGQEGEWGMGREERSFVLLQSSLIPVEEGMTIEHVPASGIHRNPTFLLYFW